MKVKSLMKALKQFGELDNLEPDVDDKNRFLLEVRNKDDELMGIIWLDELE